MKKVIFVALLAALVAGCATGNSSTVADSTQPLTLEEALQKSAQTRQKLQEAQEAYQKAKNASAAANAANTNNTVTEAIKTQIQNQISTSQTQVSNEVQAWKEVLKN